MWIFCGRFVTEMTKQINRPNCYMQSWAESATTVFYIFDKEFNRSTLSFISCRLVDKSGCGFVNVVAKL